MGEICSRYGTPGVDGFQAKVVTFENEMARKRLGHKHVVATSSGTGSLMMLLPGGTRHRHGDEVIVPRLYLHRLHRDHRQMNAIPVLAEIDESLTIDPAKIEALITPEDEAIMRSICWATPAIWIPSAEIAKKHNLYVIEDCCQAVGAVY